MIKTILLTALFIAPHIQASEVSEILEARISNDDLFSNFQKNFEDPIRDWVFDTLFDIQSEEEHQRARIEKFQEEMKALYRNITHACRHKPIGEYRQKVTDFNSLLYQLGSKIQWAQEQHFYAPPTPESKSAASQSINLTLTHILGEKRAKQVSFRSRTDPHS